MKLLLTLTIITVLVGCATIDPVEKGFLTEGSYEPTNSVELFTVEGVSLAVAFDEKFLSIKLRVSGHWPFIDSAPNYPPITIPC